MTHYFKENSAIATAHKAGVPQALLDSRCASFSPECVILAEQVEYRAHNNALDNWAVNRQAVEALLHDSQSHTKCCVHLYVCFASVASSQPSMKQQFSFNMDSCVQLGVAWARRWLCPRAGPRILNTPCKCALKQAIIHLGVGMPWQEFMSTF